MATNKEIMKKGIKNSELKKKSGEKCIYCGCDNKLALTIDHIRPLVRGGEDTNENKQVACFVCNWLKGGLTHIEYKKYYRALNIMKDLNKIKLLNGDLSLLFSQRGHPKSSKDIEEKNNHGN